MEKKDTFSYYQSLVYSYQIYMSLGCTMLERLFGLLP